jgi:exopolysaccharide transport family protein
MLWGASDSDPRKELIKGGSPLLAADPADEWIDLREIIRILRRRLRIVIATIVAAAVAAAAFMMVATPRYTATATVLVDPNRSSVANGDNDQPRATDFTTEDLIVDSQVLLMQSDAVLRRVVDELKLADDPEFGPSPSVLDPIKKLFGPGATSELSTEDVAKATALEFLRRNRLKVIRELPTRVVDISVDSQDPAEAARIANAIVDSYLYEQVHNTSGTQKAAASWFNRQIEEFRSTVMASDRAVEEFRATHGLTVAQGVTINSQQLSDLNSKLVDARTQTGEARAKFEQFQNIINTHSDPGTLGKALSSDVVARLRAQYADVAKNAADMSSKYGPQHPLVVNANAQLKATQKTIDEELRRILENTRAAYEVSKSREDALQQSLDNLTHISNDSGQYRVQWRELQREADANRTLYESFLARYREVNAQESLDLPDARIVSKAAIPIEPSFPKVAILLALSLAAGASLGGALAFEADKRDRRVKSLRQAEEVTGIPAIAAVPLIGGPGPTRPFPGEPQRSNQHAPDAGRRPPAVPRLLRHVLDQPTSLFAESVRAVRLAVQRADRAKSIKTIMVTSSTGGEGTTTLAVSLALSLTASGTRTILVEGNLRNPEISRLLCPEARVGVIDVATGQAHLEQALVVDRVTGLAVLPSPSLNKGNTEFVFSDAMRNLLERLRQRFDYIVIDSPPLVPLVEARALAQIADRIILAVRWDSTPQDVVAQAMKILALDHERVLGTVLTQVDMQRLRFYDYYQSSHYLMPYSYVGERRMETVS